MWYGITPSLGIWPLIFWKKLYSDNNGNVSDLNDPVDRRIIIKILK